MEFGSFPVGEDDENNGAGFVEISRTFLPQEASFETDLLMEYRQHRKNQQCVTHVSINNKCIRTSAYMAHPHRIFRYTSCIHFCRQKNNLINLLMSHVRCNSMAQKFK